MSRSSGSDKQQQAASSSTSNNQAASSSTGSNQPAAAAAAAANQQQTNSSQPPAAAVANQQQQGGSSSRKPAASPTYMDYHRLPNNKRLHPYRHATVWGHASQRLLKNTNQTAPRSSALMEMGPSRKGFNYGLTKETSRNKFNFIAIR